MYTANSIRNVCLLGHSGSGKSALAESLLYMTGVIDRIGRFGDVGMKGIGIVERFVITRLWQACRLQVEGEQKLKLDSEENKIAAGKLLEKVILETQQNSLATEKSAGMRSGNEFTKALTMFSADGMKVCGRVAKLSLGRS